MDHIQTKINPKPAVLIISDRWGSPFQGGIPAAVRLLAKLFHLLGFAIYCTVLQKSDKEEENAKELNVTLVPPKLRGSLEWEETDKPCRKWLHSHASYFENLKDKKILANIKIVIGFALATFEASSIIRDDVFASAKYYITNLWPCDKLPPSILGCSQESLDKLVDMLEEIHHKAADVVTSIDHQTFSYFIDTLQTNKYFQILPTPEEKYFSFNPPKVLSSDITYRILSCLEEHDKPSENAHVMLIKEINAVAKKYHAVNTKQLKWVILGVCPRKEDELIKALKPFRHLDIVPKALCPSLSYEKYLFTSHLVLIPPKSPGVNSLHLLISTMAAGVPLLVAMYSPSHDFIKTYFPYYVDDMVVDMKSQGKLAEKIQDIFKNYPCSLKKADEIKEKFKSEMVALIDNSNHDFISHIKTHFGQLVSSADDTCHRDRVSTDIPESETGEAKFKSADTMEVVEHEPSGTAGISGDKTPKVPEENPQQNVQNDGQDNGDQMASNDTSGPTDGGDIENNDINTRSTCTTGKLTIHVDQSGIPKEDNTMIQVSERFKKLPEVVEETPKQINGIYPGIEMQDTSDGSIVYHVKCTTLDALNYLWHYYTSQKLHKLITSTTVTKKTLAIIGAVYLELQITMDIEEYRQCKQELTQKGVHKLLLLGMDRSLKPPVEDLTWLLNSDDYTRQRGRWFDIFQAVMTMTDRVQHILSCRQDVLALLGVTRYLLTDASTPNLTSEALEEQLIQGGTQVPSLTGTDENCSSLVQSLLSPKTTITKVTHYWVEHLMKLGNTQLDAEKMVLQKQLSDARHEKASLEEMHKAQVMALKFDFEKVTKRYFQRLTTEQSGKSLTQSEFNLQQKILQDQLGETRRENVILEEQIKKQALEIEQMKRTISGHFEKSELDHKMEYFSVALLVISTSWDKDSQSSTTWQLIGDFCENTLKKKPAELSAIYCTVLDVELSEELREDAVRNGVTLIIATRPKWSNPAEDPPAITWLLNHDKYYPGLAKLEDITDVVGLFAKTHNAASAIQQSFFPQAKLHLVPFKPAALFVGDSWNKDGLGLTGFHRTLIRDFCERKAKAGEDLKAYSTVLDVKICDEQKKDAENCGVTLIPAQKREWADPKDELPELKWLLNHEIHYPDLRDLDNVQYVIGYAPKTGFAAADIQARLFPGAKLVLINHACPEPNCLLAEEHGLMEFEEKMLLMASNADLLISIGPRIHEYFQNAYRADFSGRQLSEIPHEVIFPRPISCSTWIAPTEGEIKQFQILTCGQLDVQEAIGRCDVMAASIGTAANQWKTTHTNPPIWKIQGISHKADNTVEKFISDKMQCPYIKPTLHPGHSANSLLDSLQQSHLCLPTPWYTDYSFYGLEAMVSGLPTAVYEDSHLAHFIKNYFQKHADNAVVIGTERNLSDTILKHMEDTHLAFKKAKHLKTDLVNSEVISTSYASFASMLTSSDKRQSEDHGAERDDKDSLKVQIGLDDSVQQYLRESERESEERSAQISRNQAEVIMAKLKATLKRKVEEVVADKESCDEVKKMCKKILDDVDPKSLIAK